MSNVCKDCERKKLYEIAVNNPNWRDTRCDKHQDTSTKQQALASAAPNPRQEKMASL